MNRRQLLGNLTGASINSTVIEWRQLQLQQDALAKWNGTLPTFVGGDNPIPFLSVTQ